ncbi:helix-turn-helix transcriptional regulator [Ideonella sp. YS5]|uniref:helix-turn-helix transcriptional regulator n=1 Tax=Ideonella sp. YS5 TaxID=3453714 RepID=UPI003EEDF071
MLDLHAWAPEGRDLRSDADTPQAGFPPCWGLQPALLAELKEAGSACHRRERVQAVLQALGFDEVGFGALDTSRGAPVVRSFCSEYADRRWTERYFARRYQEFDPRLRAIERSSLPCLWTLQELARQPVAADHRTELCALVDDLHERGVSGGLMLALPALPGQPRRFVSLLSRGTPPRRLDDAALGRVLLVAWCLDELHRGSPGELDTDEDRPMGVLSPLQEQILDLLSRGMGDKQIAARLDISRHNVDYHLRRLRKRFGVRNRVQLMHAALQTRQAG